MEKIAFLSIVVFLQSQIHAQLPEPPELNVSVYGQLISITWSEVISFLGGLTLGFVANTPV